MAGHFRTDSRLAYLLGTYRHLEDALKELIDNAWDADAPSVTVMLPATLESERSAVVVADTGTGMTRQEVEDDYLRVGRGRRVRRGPDTAGGRKAKGSKGVGKFAGLRIADVMTVVTCCRGEQTTLRVTRDLLSETDRDLERLELPLDTVPCDPALAGTTVTLEGLNQNYDPPNADRLLERLFHEYGVDRRMRVSVDGREPDVAHLSGARSVETIDVPGLGLVTFRLTVLDGDAKVPKSAAGVTFMAHGKPIGRPVFLGLDDDPVIGPRLCRAVYGVVECDAFEHVATADWGALAEGFKPLQAVRDWARGHAHSRLVEARGREVGAARGRLSQALQRRLDQLPENRKAVAKAAIEKLVTRMFGEVAEDKLNTFASLLIDALEADDYWTVMQAIDAADKGDVVAFAGALAEFGFVEATLAARQAHRRADFLDSLDDLCANAKTLEAQMHGALDRNLWYFGPEFSLVSSNRTMAAVVRKLLDKEFKGDRASRRPDLLLSGSRDGHHTLIEFKRPSHALTREDQAQAQRYRDDLAGAGHRGHTDVLVVGGLVPASFKDQTEAGGETLKFCTYASLTSQARSEIGWLLENLETSTPPHLTGTGIT